MKKARKSKFVIGGVALLSCVALAGVGYSSWVITSTVTSKQGNVTVTASAVEDDRITIGTISVTDASYSFGPATGGTLITASGESEESLSVEFTFTVSWASTLNKSYNITLALASDKTYDSADALAYATTQSVSSTSADPSFSGTYLTAPATDLIGTGITIATVSSSGVTAESGYSITDGVGLSVSVTSNTAASSDTKGSATVTVTAAFGWGTYFGGSNPVGLNDPTKLDDYITGLTWLHDAFDGATFTYTVGGAIQTTETGGETD